jgi:hypothetical protein
MVLNATFNNISAISWQSVLLVEETLSGDRYLSIFICMCYNCFVIK